MKTNETLARSIGDLVGGPENVSWVGSCTTRLRFEVRDQSQVDFDRLNETPGVLQAVSAGGQVQVVVGTHVDQVREQLITLPGWRELGEEDSNVSAKRGVIDTVFDFLGGTFQPLIPVITGAAMVQVLALLLIQFGVLDAESPTAAVLTATGNALFYFLPLFVGFTATRKLGANPFVGATIAAALLHPSFVAIGETGSVSEAFELPLFVYSYASSMFPALLLAIALAGLDRVLKRILPRALQQVFVPTLELLLLVPLTALVFGPVGVIVGNGIGAGTEWLSTNAPLLFYVLIPALWLIFVALGLHWALISIALSEIATAGSSAILGAAVGYQYAILGVALGVLIKAARNRSARAVRDTAAAATVAAGIGGITEPTIYGLVLRYRRLLVIELISAAASGAVLGLFGAKMIGFTPAPILGLPIMQPTLGAVIALVVAVVLPIILIQIWGYEKRDAAEGDASAKPAQFGGFRGVVDSSTAAAASVITAPLAGRVIPLSETGDPIFAEALIGPGVSIVPASNRIVAPFSATVVAAPSTAHAVGLRADDGTELLIHIGIDTVKLEGRHFTLLVTQGQRVAAGETLVEFDGDAIIMAGYSTVTPVVVTNLASGQALDAIAAGDVVEGEPLLSLGARAAIDTE